MLQALFPDSPHYNILSATGPDHEKKFVAAVVWRGEVLGQGEGVSKKTAEVAAASDALKQGKVAVRRIKDSMAGNCPFLPQVDRVWRAKDMAPFRQRRDSEFYLAALSYAQSLLGEGKPAQALLQINKSFLADLGDEAVLKEWPPSYQAVVWIIERYRKEDENFLGNPVRHYQHLATRMSGPRGGVRTLRAWACFHLAEVFAPEFSRDHEQIENEKVVVPTFQVILEAIDRFGWTGEGDVLRGTLARLKD